MTSAPDSIGNLICLLQKRDPDALTRIVEENSRVLYRAARGMSFSREEAEDLVQDVFATFLETLDRFGGRSQMRTWLFGILHNKVRERRRDHYRDQQNDPIDEVFESRFDSRGSWARPPRDPDQAVTSEEIASALSRCLEDLPASQKEVFVLREMEDLETPEICKILGISVTNMSVLMHRARIRLRECMEGRGWRNAP